jgi:hypothetical protein
VGDFELGGEVAPVCFGRGSLGDGSLLDANLLQPGDQQHGGQPVSLATHLKRGQNHLTLVYCRRASLEIHNTLCYT